MDLIFDEVAKKSMQLLSGSHSVFVSSSDLQSVNATDCSQSSTNNDSSKLFVSSKHKKPEKHDGTMQNSVL